MRFHSRFIYSLRSCPRPQVLPSASSSASCQTSWACLSTAAEVKPEVKPEARSAYFATKLVNRRVVRLTGPDTFPYIQTLITNDVRHLVENQLEPGRSVNCIYSFLQNSMGRVLTDVLVFKPTLNSNLVERCLALAPYRAEEFGGGGQEDDELLLEVDAQFARPLARTLFALKIRRKVRIELADEMNAWVLYPSFFGSNSKQPAFAYDLRSEHFGGNLQEVSSREFILSRDPRLNALGYRLLTSLEGKTFEDIRKYFSHENVTLTESKLSEYQRFRYRIGVGEGVDDHSHCNCFALEANADLLNGVSFTKGVYCGEDIVARNYRKGVVRRLMPIEFLLPEGQTESYLETMDLLPGSEIIRPDNRFVGYLVQRRGRHGLASLKVKSILREGLDLIHKSSNMRIKTWTPYWLNRERIEQKGLPDGKPRHLLLQPVNP